MDMGLYEVPLSMSFLCFRMWSMLTNFHVWGIMLVLRAVFNMFMRNASPRGPMCFRCLMFNCYLYFVFLSSWTWVVVSVMLYPCMLRVTQLVYLFVLTVFDSVRELFGDTIRNVFGCGCYFVAECYGCV